MLALLLACSGPRATRQAVPEAEWIRNRPTSREYYIGLGQANKTGSPNDYMQQAKQNALADLASEISINVSANSALSAFETRNIYIEDFSQTVRAETQKELEGYELVDTWEGPTQYWAYYRLSKAHYQQQQQLKRSTATQKSANLLDKATQSLARNDAHMGIVLLIRAMEPILPYLNESLDAQLGGRNIALGSELIEQLMTATSKLRIDGPQNVSTKVGATIDPSTLRYSVSYGGKAQASIPLQAVYTEHPLTSPRATTASNGKASFSTGAIRSAKSTEQLTVSIDMATLVKEATADLTLKRILAKLTAPSHVTTISIQKPSVLVQITPHNEQHQKLLHTASSKLSELGVSPKTEGRADYTLLIHSTSSSKRSNNGLWATKLDTKLTLTDEHNAERYAKNLSINGSHFNPEQAVEAAYNELSKKLSTSTLREIVEGTIKGRKAY